jgi:hypothetical protein
MNKWDIRTDVSAKIEGVILPHIMKELREQSRNLDMDVHRSYKCVVNLEERTCCARNGKYQGFHANMPLHSSHILGNL